MRHDDRMGHRRARFILPLVALTMGALLTGSLAGAQTEAEQAGQKAPQEMYETLYLRHVTGRNQAAEILTVFRNELQRARVNFVASENAIAIRGTAEDIAAAHKILEGIDRPTPTYRLTYAIADGDGGSAASHPYALTVASDGGTAELKEGKRIPLVTGTTAPGTSEASNQVQYIDVGIMISAEVEGSDRALRLRTKVEQSEIDEEKSGMGAQDPVIRQTTLENTVTLVPGKAMVLGSLEAPGTGKKQEVSVVAEAVE